MNISRNLFLSAFLVFVAQSVASENPAPTVSSSYFQWAKNGIGYMVSAPADYCGAERVAAYLNGFETGLIKNNATTISRVVVYAVMVGMVYGSVKLYNACFADDADVDVDDNIDQFFSADDADVNEEYA